MTKLWGGRFSKKTNKLVEDFSNSIHFDQKLAKYDVIGSLLHINVLKKAKIISAAEHSRLKTGLNSILKSIESGIFFKNIDHSFEDIHSYIQALLEKKAGQAALKLHSCRSRNDQVVLDTKLYALDHISLTIAELKQLYNVLQSNAKKNETTVITGYTHLQHAIPVKLADYFEAYMTMILRDAMRLISAQVNIEVTMGSGALAGTMIPSAHYTQKIFGLKTNKKVHAPGNALETVSDRDFIIEILSALSITGMHLSRLAEDMILWVSKEFDFIDIDDAFCTGSSLMPQKKNPDVLELIRGYTGRLNGNLVSVLTVMKGLPLSYNRDMQLDKEPLFDSFEIVRSEINVLSELLKNVKFKKQNINKQLDDECLYATDLADHLVKNGVAFKTAHAIIGKLISYKLKNNTLLVNMTTQQLSQYHRSLTPSAVQKIINPANSVASKKSIRRTKRSRN